MHWRGIDLGAISLHQLALDGEAGREWYQDSWRSICDYAFRHGRNADRVADVLSILSPRVTVEHSIRLADSYLRTGSAPGAMRQRLEALARYETSGVFNGPKVNAFSAALQGDPDAIVIDAWMYRAVRERRTTAKAYRDTSSLIAACAQELGWPGREAQAAIWQGARMFVGYADGYKPMRLEGF